VYVTTILPIILSGKPPGAADVLFCASRFFLVYSICIIFDYRDRESDKKEGIKSMVTFLDESGVNKLFYTSVLIFVLSTASLSLVGFSFPATIFLLLPGIIVLCLYGVARRSFSDYLYYFVLDGLMMFSALFTSFLSN
jgi:4-hydroxybenzoate polyprenyltransferase